MTKPHASRRPVSHRHAHAHARRRFALAFDALESRQLLSADPGRLVITVATRPMPTPNLVALASSEGATVKTTDLPGVVQATGDPAAVARLDADLSALPGVSAQYGQTLSVDLTPNDPSYTNNSMWGLNGSFGINAPAAWNTTTGSAKVVVADIDTGLDYNHPDIYDNVWINQAEIPASRMKNLTDVDGDGVITFRDLNNPVNIGTGKITDVNGDGRIDGADLIAPMQKDAGGNDTGLGGWADGVSEDGDAAHLDDIIGWNFLNNTNNPLDDFGHGTHTAGTIGAVGNNATGVVGVNWNVQIMPLLFIGSNGQGSDTDAASAIRYAADHGARVSNNSYGDSSDSSALESAIQYAQTKGEVVVAAAGNSGTNNDTTPFYPAASPSANVIAVAALNSDGTLASFSNYGAKSVALAAPGVNIISTTPNGNYGVMSGTSMATPHVTGTIGLLLSLHPNWTYTQLINQVESTVTPDPSLAGKTITGGYLNAAAAISGGAGPAASVTFVKADAATQGNWKTSYGADGYDVVGDPSAGNPSLPSYASLGVTGAQGYVWAGSTSDVRALQKSAAGSTDRVAATWYSTSNFSVDVHMTDGNAHQVALYALDWDRQSRSETVQVVDDASGTVLDTRTLTGFQNGTYLVWNVQGSVTFRVTNTSTTNAVISGLFFGGPASNTPPPPPPPAATASFVKADAATQGNWKTSYGADGYDVVGDPSGGNPAIPSYASLGVTGAQGYVWAGSTSDVRALQKSAAGSTDRVAGTWYSGSSFSVDVHMTDGKAHQVALYALDWDNHNRTETVQVIDDATGTVLDTRSVSSFQNGTYLVWSVQGNVTFRVTNNGTTNAVVSGLFFG